MYAVAPRAGAWIETIYTSNGLVPHSVAPRAGAWIETNLGKNAPAVVSSLPARERGLKPRPSLMNKKIMLVAPRAGAWIETNKLPLPDRMLLVAPRAGAWIETLHLQNQPKNQASLPARERGLKLSWILEYIAGRCRSPRGSVD